MELVVSPGANNRSAHPLWPQVSLIVLVCFGGALFKLASFLFAPSYPAFPNSRSSLLLRRNINACTLLQYNQMSAECYISLFLVRLFHDAVLLCTVFVFNVLWQLLLVDKLPFFIEFPDESQAV
jgi:hypothetical protein